MLPKPTEQIELFRGGSVVSTFVGSFGSALRETRLTALLGYLIAVQPEPFLELFDFPGKAQGVRLENHHGADRSDILIETTKGVGIIEAKIGSADPFNQAKKYGAKWTVLLTNYAPSLARQKWKKGRYLSWQEVANLLDKLDRSHNANVRFISRDLHNYLEDKYMIRRREPVEIYAREINEPVTLALFLKARMYGCRYDKGSRLPEAHYFAPHFGQSIANMYPGVHVGISYISKIEKIEVVQTWHDLMNTIQTIRGKHWLNSNASIIKPLKSKWSWGGNKSRSFIFLGEPRLVFNPPVLKDQIQKGKGWLSKRFLSFDELFAGWGS
ncbi:MAG: hypothetical protein HYZ52_00025 [Candidatus Omnitrophica bacterium]|nr:hypothetical protein [Candidatus Omnitrophota bacterium]